MDRLCVWPLVMGLADDLPLSGSYRSAAARAAGGLAQEIAAAARMPRTRLRLKLCAILARLRTMAVGRSVPTGAGTHFRILIALRKAAEMSACVSAPLLSQNAITLIIVIRVRQSRGFPPR
jgi:hypothetical protein